MYLQKLKRKKFADHHFHNFPVIKFRENFNTAVYHTTTVVDYHSIHLFVYSLLDAPQNYTFHKHSVSFCVNVSVDCSAGVHSTIGERGRWVGVCVSSCHQGPIRVEPLNSRWRERQM